jgi:hypothetical protein
MTDEVGGDEEDEEDEEEAEEVEELHFEDGDKTKSWSMRKGAVLVGELALFVVYLGVLWGSVARLAHRRLLLFRAVWFQFPYLVSLLYLVASIHFIFYFVLSQIPTSPVYALD